MIVLRPKCLNSYAETGSHRTSGVKQAVQRSIVLLIASLMLAGCGSEPPIAKKAVSQSAETPSSTAAPVKVESQGNLPSAPAVPNSSGDGHTINTGETFEHKLTVGEGDLTKMFKQIATFDAHNSVGDAEVATTVAKMKALKVGENIGGELHSDSKAGHETMRIIIVRKTEKEFEVTVQTQTAGLRDEVKKRLGS